MNIKFKEAHLRRNKFSRLGTWYILALSIIATTAIVGQILIQNHLSNQLSDSRVVNVAGRQRMLSQRISKDALLLSSSLPYSDRQGILNELTTSVNLWKTSQDGLLHGNDSLHLPANQSEEVAVMFENIQPHFDAIYNSSMNIMHTINNDENASPEMLRANVQIILDHEQAFLSGMDAIVFHIDDEAYDKVSTLSRLEYALIGISILIILLEIVFIFRPTAIQVNKTVNQLISSEQNAKELTKEIGALYGSLEKSYEQLSQVNQPIENPKIYAKADHGGNITFISDLFMEMSGIEDITPGMRLCDLFYGSNLDNDWMDEIVESISEGRSWNGEIHFKGFASMDMWVELLILPVYEEDDEIEELLVLGADITLQRIAEKNMRKKNKAEVEKKINQQKFRSVLILEGQEEERKRIAMDIHDGIGQMLSSLKYQVESIDMDENPKVSSKMNEIKQGIKDVIKEVRKVTFNLKPTVLGDYGLQAALNVFVQEIGKLTDIDLIYHTEGNMTYRLPQKVENNIFRIVQEAINNAIKYSEAEKIEVLLQQTENDFIITVKDEGKGFDEKIIEARDINIESGRGFFNMYERTEYVNGNLEIKSAPGQGTKVILTVPIRSAATIDV